MRSASAAVDWKRFTGTTLEVNLVKSPRSEILLKYLPEFEELTGIKVNAEATPEQQQRQKTTIELSSGKPSFDVVHMRKPLTASRSRRSPKASSRALKWSRRPGV